MSHMLKIGPQSGHQKVVERGKNGIHWLGLDIGRLGGAQRGRTELGGGGLELASAPVPCDRDLPARRITPDQVKLVSAGMASWRRDIRLYIPPGSPIGQRMIIGETI